MSARNPTHGWQGLASPRDQRACGTSDIYLTSKDELRLRALILSQRTRFEEDVRAFLRQKLDKARICEPDEILPQIVTMNSRVRFRRHVGENSEIGTLVYDDAAPDGNTISIVTRLGAALLGLRVPTRLVYESAWNEKSIIDVERIVYQPEAHGRLRPDPYRRWSKLPDAHGNSSSR